MGIIKVLKRKDASSIIVAVVIAMILIQLIPSLVGQLAVKMTGVDEMNTYAGAYPGAGWKTVYLFPVVWAILQVAVLELLVWLYVLLHGAVSKKK